MKKNYQTPKVHIRSIRVNSLLNDVSNIPIGGSGGADAKSSSFDDSEGEQENYWSSDWNN